MDHGAEYIRGHKEHKGRLWRIPKPKYEDIKDRNIKFDKKVPSFDPDSR
jgi:hypothetical protein